MSPFEAAIVKVAFEPSADLFRDRSGLEDPLFGLGCDLSRSEVPFTCGLSILINRVKEE